MLIKILVGCSLAGVCLVAGCSDGGRTIYIINAGDAGGAQTSGGAAQGGSSMSGGSGTGGGDAGGSQGGANPGAGGGSAGDAGAGTSGGTGPSGGAGGVSGECNSLAAGDPVVEATAIDALLPTMSGGMIYDGAYRYTQRLDYDGSCDCSHAQAFVISGSGTHFEENYDGMRQTGTLSLSGTTLTFNYTCPTVRTYSVEYTASDIELRLWTADDLRLDVFARF